MRRVSKFNSSFLYCSHRFVPGPHSSFTHAGVPGLHLQHGAEELLGGLGEEANLSIGVETIQIRRLWRQSIVYVLYREIQVQVRHRVRGTLPVEFAVLELSPI